MDKINVNDFDDEAIKNVIDELKYRSYRYNRNKFPEIAPDRYTAIFGVDAYLYEMRFQKE